MNTALVMEALALAAILRRQDISREVVAIHYASGTLNEDNNPSWEIHLAASAVPTLEILGAKKVERDWGTEYRLRVNSVVTIYGCKMKEAK
jgi:hypothetical protein